VALVAQSLAADPFAGDIFVFRAKRTDRIKLLLWDGADLCLVTKRLEAGGFTWPPVQDGAVTLSTSQLPAGAGGCLLRLRRLCRVGWRAAGNAPRRAGPAPRRNRMPDSEGTPLAVNASEADYAARRIALGLPDCAPDLEPQKTPALEAGFDELHGITWDKARYMGQELTARTKYRGPVKRRLVPVEFSATGEAPGTPVMAEGQEVGNIRSCGKAGAHHAATGCAGAVTYCWRRGTDTAPTGLGAAA